MPTLDTFGRRTLVLEKGDLRLSYLLYEGPGPALVLIPGSFSDSRQWENVMSRLPEDWTILLAELRGHGESWPPSLDATIESFARDVLDLADHAGLDRFYVGGHSIGGMIAPEVGRQAPGRIQGIIMMEGWSHYSAAREAFNNQMYTTLSEDQQAFKAKRREETQARWSLEQIEYFGNIWKRWDGREFLRETDLPILSMWGDRNLDPGPTLEQLAVPERSNIEVRWVEGASHSLPLERPQEMAEAIVVFVRRVSESGGDT